MHPQARLAIQRAGELPSGLNPAELREHYDRVRIPLQPPRPDIRCARPIQIDTRAGKLSARLYSTNAPDEIASSLLIYFHGGGWVVGSLNGYETLCRQLAITSGWTILSVDYRLAPEYKFPAAVNDAYDSLVWAITNARLLGIDKEKIAVGGDSAGATLSTVVCHINARKKGPKLASQILIYGAYDLSQERASFERYANGYMLNRDAIRWFYSQYLETSAQKFDWRASPILAGRFEDLPPALFVTAECDPLIDENVEYAQILREHGIPVEYVCFQGMIHPFLSMGRIIDDAKIAERLIGKYLKNI
jgi:acetyl esterase